jgi:hypothetical protein
MNIWGLGDSNLMNTVLLDQKISVFFGHIQNISGAYCRCLVAHYVLVAHIAICATHKILMAHMLYAPLTFKICVAHIVGTPDYPSGIPDMHTIHHPMISVS